MRTATARVPAKINLQLSVGPRRDDGYHDLVSVFHAVNLYDEVTAAPTALGTGVSLSIEGAQRDLVPADETNLAWRAAQLLAEDAGVDADVHLRIVKAIPVAGGMAGGSADAAGALVACAQIWDLDYDRTALMSLAASLGSDVPFCLQGGTAVGRGRGDVLSPALGKGDLHWVVALSDTTLSTPAVYAECDRLRAGARVAEPVLSDGLMHALRAGDAAGVGQHLANDLEEPALSLRPGLRLLLETGMEFGALGGIVSGSGPTCVFLARGREHALDLAVALSASGQASGVRHAMGPVAGARLIA